MTAISEKLKYRKSSVTTEITLYDDTGDVGSDYLSLQVGAATVYAKLGLISDPQATDMRARKGDTTYAVLLEALEELPSGFMGFADAACPSGWTQKTSTNWDDEFLKGGSSYAAATGSHSHNHSYNPGNRTSTTTTTVVYHQSTGSGPLGFQSSAKHSHIVNIDSVNSDTIDHQPPFAQFIMCEKD